MAAIDAVAVLEALTAAGADPCVGGGWAVDALLGEQTREHVDLDLWLLASELAPPIATFVELEIDRLLPWPGDWPWNWPVHDGRQRRVDLHFYEALPDGSLHFGSVTRGHRFPPGALAGRGVIGGVAVRCEAAKWSVRWHTGYPPRDVDRHDVPRLCARFGLELPSQYRRESPGQYLGLCPSRTDQVTVLESRPTDERRTYGTPLESPAVGPNRRSRRPAKLGDTYGAQEHPDRLAPHITLGLRSGQTAPRPAVAPLGNRRIVLIGPPG